MTTKIPLRVMEVDSDGSLRVPDWVPAPAAKLADDLYTYVTTPQSIQWNEDSVPERLDEASTLIWWSSIMDTPALELSGSSSWNDLLTMDFGALSGRVTDLMDGWMLDSRAMSQHPWGFPSKVIAIYGLVRLDESLSSSADAATRLNGACVAGRCLGVAAFLAGLDQGNRDATREKTISAATARWAPINEIRAQIRDRYRQGDWVSKAQFIRAVQNDVIAAAEEKGTRLAPTNVQLLIRKWLQGL